MSKPYVIAAHSIKEFNSYYDFLYSRFSNINYQTNSTYYIQGCDEAIGLCLNYLKEHDDSVSGLVSFIKTRKSTSERRVKDAYNQGFLEGFLLVTDALNEAKYELMEEVKKAVSNL